MADRTRVVALRQASGACERDVLEACEATFNIDIETDEAEALRTVGDLYGVIRWKCEHQSLGPTGASIAESYRRLKAYLTDQGIARPIRPTSALDAVFGPDPRPAWARLRKAFGKSLPRLALSDGQLVFASMLLALGLSGGVFGGLTVSDVTGAPALGVAAGLLALGLSVLAVMAYSFLFARSIPFGLRTMGDLARLVAGRKGACKPAQLWEALEDIIRRDAGFDGKVTADLTVELPKNR